MLVYQMVIHVEVVNHLGSVNFCDLLRSEGIYFGVTLNALADVQDILPTITPSFHHDSNVITPSNCSSKGSFQWHLCVRKGRPRWKVRLGQLKKLNAVQLK